ncbi:MAG: nucleotide exchange factor GrpE [Dissulfurimicrobium sp.]|nr:nucleotide exchange factor GrpE [Dissulfurimicrobium hydrothermale]UKL13380.1 nucleotide exchange factor GrpE [Dissulfurimicrobium hydrothermale]
MNIHETEQQEQQTEVQNKEQDQRQDQQQTRGQEDYEELVARLKEKDQEIAACKDKMLRLAAELENFKKRIEREKEEHMKYALESFSNELLPFLDNLERAVAASKESRDIDRLIEGLELTLSGYLKTLERFGLKTFVAEGQRFDPNLHEAICIEESHEHEENTVIKELLKGYTLHEKLLRPALVVVSKKPCGGSGQGETSA